MKQNIVVIILTILYFLGFYFANDKGFEEVSKSTEKIQYTRLGFPYDCPFHLDVSDLNSGELIRVREEAYQSKTFWLHAYNGIYWFAFYFVFFGLFWVKCKKG